MTTDQTARIAEKLLDATKRPSNREPCWCVDYAPIFPSRYGADGKPICVKCEYSYTAHLMREAADLLTTLQAAQWTCKAKAPTDPPQDCDWPHCGCDPHAESVLAALSEEGWATPATVTTLQAATFELEQKVQELTDSARGGTMEIPEDRLTASQDAGTQDDSAGTTDQTKDYIA